ncbi:hypothetical protein [Falsiroseomonas sp. CW058]|uniref:hypothetical protein n=1 Tax=Falsiroseomonas sp. CW058 TaxID=3388664 RepID=UPI003D31FED9
MAEHPAPVVLLDVDDVLIDWSGGFHPWMLARGAIRDPGGAASWDLCGSYPGLAWGEILAEINAFARSDSYRDMPLRDGAAREVAALRAAGCDVYAVTCCGTDPAILANREHQLRDLPLKGVFPLDHSDPKAPIYARFLPGAVVVDDAPKHLETAMRFGHAAIAYDAPWNGSVRCTDRMRDWTLGAIRIIRNLGLVAA